MRILADASLPKISEFFDKSFVLSLYYNESDLLRNINDADILLCRSTLQVNARLLQSSNIKYVATASSGSDNVDVHYLKSRGIKLIDAKGTNAQAVCDYVLATLAWLTLHGYINAPKIGIVGVGAVGTKLWQILELFGFSVIGYDPLKASDFKSCTIADLSTCDVICLHANLHASLPNPSLNLFDSNLLKKLKKHAVIINAARGEIVEESALLSLPNKIIYCTDVFANEPNISQDVLDYATLATPHIAGHSVEAKINAVKKISVTLKSLLNYAEFDYAYSKVKSLQDFLADLDASTTQLKVEFNSICDKVLNIYNPVFETEILKSAKDKAQAFVELRKKHTFRHDFFYLET